MRAPKNRPFKEIQLMDMRSVLPPLTQTCLLAALVLGLSSCAVDETGRLILFAPAEVSKANDPKSPYYSPNHHIHVNDRELDSLNSSNSRIEIDLGDQRARVYKRNGKGPDSLVIETQVSSGKQGYTTPSGNFKILEKSATKKSNLYGEWVDSSSGATLIRDGESWNPPKGKKARFKGAVMPHWLRITSSGVGMHVGYVPNHPASHGCVRVPPKVQPLIFSKVGVGTPVKIIH